MASDLTKGTLSGREHFMVYNDASHASANWVQMDQARNLAFGNKRDSSVVELHGNADNDHTVGNKTKDGSFEYVKRRGTDDIYNDIKTAYEDDDIIELGWLDGPENDANSVGLAYPCRITDISKSASGNSETTYNVTFVKVNAYLAGTLITEFAITGTA